MQTQIIVPTGQGGVSDYGDRIAHELRAMRPVDVFAINKDCVHVLQSSDVGNKTVFLQYSGYGYATRGAPKWLLEEICNLRSKGNSIGIFFHELYAAGPPWRSQFWLSSFQKSIAFELASISDWWITNRQGSANLLNRFSGNKPHAILPVFSNVGEANEPYLTRLPKMIVFGSSELRESTYKRAGKKLFAWAKRNFITIHDIGSPITNKKIAEELLVAKVIIHGRMGCGEIETHFKDAAFGLVAYPTTHVAKSGVFAAYCAFGVCPILLSTTKSDCDKLISGINYLSDIPFLLDFHAANKVGMAAWSWYKNHNLSKHVGVINSLICDTEIRGK